MECTICNLQYIGKNETPFNIRLDNHRKDVKDPKAILPRKHSNVVLMLLLGSYDVTTLDNIEIKLKQRCERWNNVAYVKVKIHYVEQHRINVVYFNVDINNVIQCRNKVVIFNIEFHNVDVQNPFDFIPHFKRNMKKNICKTAKKCYDIFKPPHFVKYWLAFKGTLMQIWKSANIWKVSH